MTPKKKARQIKSQALPLANISETLLRAIAANFPNSYISIIEKDLTISFCAGQEFKKQDLNPNNFIGLHISEIFGSHTAVVKKHYQATLRGEVKTFELFFNNQYQLYKTVPLLDDKKNVDRLLVVVENVTAQKTASEKLRRSEALLKATIDSLPFDFFALDEKGTYFLINSTLQSSWGNVLGKRPQDVADTDDTLRLWLDNNKRALKGETVDEEVEFPLGNQLKNYRNIISPIRDGEHILGVLGINIDITHERQAEESLKKTESRLRSMIEQTTDAVFCYEFTSPIPIDLPLDDQVKRMYDCTLVECNLVCARAYGAKTVEEVVGRKLEDLFGTTTGSLDTLFRQVVQGGYRIVDGEATEKLPDGTELFFLNNGHGVIENRELLRIWGTFRNITDRKKTEREKAFLEEQIRQTQKIEALGTLAGGIAHDFNNILGAITGYTELIKTKLADSHTSQKDLQQILKATERAKEMIYQILMFSRKDEQARKPVYVNKFLSDSLKLLRPSIPSFIEIKTQISENISPILLNPAQLHQVIMNICANAAHSMRVKGGILEITLKELDQKDVRNDAGQLPPGRYQQLGFHDTGVGMTEKVKNRIFEPYFTTKKEGEGTGFGLAVVHGIVQSLDGKVTVQSIPGKGTTFYVYFPVMKESKQILTEEEEEVISRGSEKILLVDDEKNLLDIGKKELTGLGYQVYVRSNSKEALKFIKEKGGEIDILITDQTMPKMTGIQLTAEVRKIYPHLPVVICTGYSDQINNENYQSMGFDAYIMKPFKIKDIAITIRKVLDK